jgi:hypothetical protein
LNEQHEHLAAGPGETCQPHRGTYPAEEVERVGAEFRALFTEDRITSLIAAAPELSTAQRTRLAGLLNGQ